jgi:hypothetical protein
MTEIPMTETVTKTIDGSGGTDRFEPSVIGILNLPFDAAQGGELVEPFRISIFDIRIYTPRCKKSAINPSGYGSS